MPEPWREAWNEFRDSAQVPPVSRDLCFAAGYYTRDAAIRELIEAAEEYLYKISVANANRLRAALEKVRLTK